MRLRRKPWIDEAIHEYDLISFCLDMKNTKANGVSYLLIQSVHYIWSLVRVKGLFIAGMSEAYPNANFVGFEVQLGVIYYAAQKIFEGERDNAKVCLFDIAGIEEVVEPGEVDRFYINFVIHGLKQNMLNAALHIIHSSTVMLVF